MHTIPINWSNIDTVFLDMDGTLLDLHYDNYFWLEYMPEQYAEKHTLSLKESNTILSQKTKAIEGSLEWYCLDYWQRTLDMDIVSLKHNVADRIGLREHVLEFLSFLRVEKKHIVLLTNAHQKTIDVKFNYINLKPYFDDIITSHTIGLAKEQAGFWQSLSKQHSFVKERSLFIDDNLDVLNTAQEFGIAQLFAINKPDSKQPIKDTKNYIGIDNYTQIMR